MFGSKTVGAVFGFVQSLANTGTKAADIGSNSMDMLDEYVNRAKREQKYYSNRAFATNLDRIDIEEDERAAELELDIEKRCSDDTAFRDTYDLVKARNTETYKDLRAALIEEHKGILTKATKEATKAAKEADKDA